MRKRRDNGNDTSAQAAFNVPLRNQLAIKCNKTSVVDILDWEKALVSASFDLNIELRLKQN